MPDSSQRDETGSRPRSSRRRVCYDHGVPNDAFAERAAIRCEVRFR